MINQYGYQTDAPNPPFHLRDVQNKCPECGTVFVAASGSGCPACANNHLMKSLNAAMDSIFKKQGELT